MSRTVQLVLQGGNRRLFRTTNTFDFSIITDPLDSTYFVEIMRQYADLLVPINVVNPPDWVDVWASIKNMGLIVEQQMIVYALPLEYVTRALNRTFTDRTHSQADPMSEMVGICPDIAHIVHLLALATTDPDCGYQSYYRMNAVNAWQWVFQDVHVEADPSDATGATFIADFTNVPNVTGVPYIAPRGHDLAYIIQSSGSLTEEEILARRRIPYLLNGVCSQRSALYMEGLVFEQGRQLNYQASFGTPTSSGFAPVLRCMAKGISPKWKLKYGAHTDVSAMSTQPTQADLHYSYRDGAVNSGISAVMLAISGKAPTLAQPRVTGNVPTKEVAWWAYALDLMHSGSGIVDCMRRGVEFDAVKRLAYYTLESPSGNGVEYRIMRKVEGENRCDPSIFSLTDDAITQFRSYIQSPSPDNALIDFTETLAREPIYTDPDNHRSVYMWDSETAYRAKAFFGRNLRALCAYESIPNDSPIKRDVAMPALAAYDQAFRLPAGAFIVADQAARVINYGPISQQDGSMLDAYYELQAFADLLEMTKSANEAVTSSATLTGKVVQNVPEEEEPIWTRLWSYLKQHPIILLIIILIAAFLIIKYIVPKLIGG